MGTCSSTGSNCITKRWMHAWLPGLNACSRAGQTLPDQQAHCGLRSIWIRAVTRCPHGTHENRSTKIIIQTAQGEMDKALGSNSHICPVCFILPASSPASPPKPQKKSARTALRIAPPVSCAIIS